mgnify:FL=1
MQRSFRNSLIIILFFTPLFKGFSQDFKYVNELTENLYLENKWDELIIVGDSIIKTKLDFYALRLRVGLAYYYKNEYLLATPHFLKAIEMNNAENIAVEYLYYSYLKSEQYLQALNIMNNQNEYVKQTVGFNSKKIIQSTQIREGIKLSNSEYIPTVYETDIDVDFKFLRSNNLKLSLNQISQKNNIWAIKQLQFYTAISIPLKNNWNFHSGFSSLKYDYSVFSFNSTNITKGNQWVVSVEMYKYYLKNQFNFGFVTFFGNNVNHNQFTFGYTYFPKANSKLYFGMNYFASTHNGFVNLTSAFKPFFGYKLTSKIGLSSSILKGGGHNLVTYNGEIVNNNYNITSHLYEIGLYYRWHPKWQTSVYYNLELKQNENINNYQYNALFINLKFIP